MSEIQELNLQKTAVWTLIVVNCWKILRESFCQRINNLKFWADTCGSVKSIIFLLVRYNFWNKVGDFSEIQTSLFLVLTQIKWTFVVSIIHFSSKTYSPHRSKTAAYFCGSSIQYYFDAPNFYTRIVLRLQKGNSYKTAVWTLIVHKCAKSLLSGKNFCPKLFFQLENDWESFLRYLSTFIILCCECTVIKTMRICWKTQVFAKTCIRFGSDFYSTFRCTHHLIFIDWWLFFARTDFWFGCVRHSKLLFHFLFSRSHGFVHQMFSWYPMSSTTVLDIVSTIRGTFRMIEEFEVNLHCFATARWTNEHSSNKSFFSVRKPETNFWCELETEWLFQKTLPLANVKLTLDCCHCAVRARLRR